MGKRGKRNNLLNNKKVYYSGSESCDSEPSYINHELIIQDTDDELSELCDYFRNRYLKFSYIDTSFIRKYLNTNTFKIVKSYKNTGLSHMENEYYEFGNIAMNRINNECEAREIKICFYDDEGTVDKKILRYFIEKLVKEIDKHYLNSRVYRDFI